MLIAFTHFAVARMTMTTTWTRATLTRIPTMTTRRRMTLCTTARSG